MTGDQADTLADRLVNSFPRRNGDVTIDEWADVLRSLEEGRAGTALVRLRDELDHAPSIRQFRTKYTSLHTASSDEKCEQCGGDGSITGPTFERHGHTYTSAIPCPSCDTGRVVARWMYPYVDDRAKREERQAVTDEQLATVTNLFEDTPL